MIGVTICDNLYKEGTWFYNSLFIGNDILNLIAVLDLRVLMKPKISHLNLGPIFANWCVSGSPINYNSDPVWIACQIELYCVVTFLC